MIEEIVAIHTKIPLTRTFRIAVSSAVKVENVIIGIKSDGIRGFGEAPPSIRLSGESVGSVLDTLNIISDRLLKAETRREIYELLDRIHGGPALKAGIEGALRDLSAKKGKLSPVELRNTKKHVETDMTISLDEPERQAEEAEKYASEGFKVLKVKLDGDEEKNVERIKKIRERLPDIRLRIDFNTALKPRRAYRHMKELEKFEIEIFEQPVKRIRRLLPVKIDTPIFADESASNVDEAIRLIDEGISGIVLKLAKHGLEGARFLIDYARRQGALTLVGCTSESGVGTSFLTALAAMGATFADIDSDVHLLHVIDKRTFPSNGIRTVPDVGFTSLNSPDDIPSNIILNKRRWGA